MPRPASRLPRRARARAALLPALLLLAACGSGGGAQDRPELTGSFPPTGAVVPAGLSSIRIDFDEPVTLFLSQGLELRIDGTLQGVVLSQHPSQPQSILLTPLEGTRFLSGGYRVDVLPGLVLNADEHYALEPVTLTFTLGAPPPLYLAVPAPPAVHEVDGSTFAPLGSVPTPGGRAPVAVLPTRRGNLTRVFVQLAAGGALDAPLAVYTPGDAAMQELTLSAPPGSDLVAPAGALWLSQDGTLLYAAYQETLSGAVRLVRVRTADGVETGALTLARPTGPAPWQAGALVLRGDQQTLLVAQHDGTQGALAYVDLPSFTELDRDALTSGVQPQGLPFRPVAADRLADALMAASPDDATAVLRSAAFADGTPDAEASTQVGTPTCVLTTIEGRFVLEGLAALPGSSGLLAVRRGADLAADSPLVVSDLLGTVSQGATRVRALARVPGGQRLYALLDADLIAVLSYTDDALTQDDLDPSVDGVQAGSLSAGAPGATALGVLATSFAD